MFVIVSHVITFLGVCVIPLYRCVNSASWILVMEDQKRQAIKVS